MKRGISRVVSQLAFAALVAACGSGESGEEITSREGEIAKRAAPAALQEPSVTLITGDRVTLRNVDGKSVPVIEPGAGRAKMEFQIQRSRGELRIIPRDAAELIGRGSLDRELFNVTRLLAEGYGDQEMAATPLLVTGLAKGFRLQASGLAAGAGLAVGRSSAALGMMAVRQAKGAAAASLLALASGRGGAGAARASGTAGVKIWLDRKRRPSLDQSVVQVGAPAAYGRGLSGAGVKIAVLDTGVDATHPDLAGKVVAAATFVPDGRGPEDVFGHGTHVASIAAGSGAASGGQYHGVAPGAQIINARVCDEFGCFDSDILAGMEWAVAQGAQVINMSLGGTDEPELDPLEEAVNALAEAHGVLFVVAAGNEYGAAVGSPSSADAALCVSAVDRSDALAVFSSVGPRTGDHGLKPDLAAPGVAIAAARAAGTAIGAPLNAFYTRLNGTSMATPHVAGAAALLLEQHPSWTYAELKAALMGAAHPKEGMNVYQQGAGRLDVDRATAQAVRAEVASLGFEPASYPHGDDPVQVRTVRYRNDGAAALTLSLAGSLRHRGGAAPAGLLSISPATLTVPAGGSAEAVVTVDTRGELPAGLYGGALTATSGEVRILTPLGVYVEAESRDLKVVLVGADGQPATGSVSLRGLGAPGTELGDRSESSVRVEGAQTFRVPVGRYFVEAILNNSLLIAPNAAVSADVSVVMDERLAEAPQLSLPRAGLERVLAQWDYEDVAHNLSSILVVPSGDLRATAQIGEGAPAGEIQTNVSVLYAMPDEPGDDDEEVLYHVARTFFDEVPRGWRQAFRARDFATVTASYGAPGEDLPVALISPIAPRAGASFAQITRFHAGPFRRTEHYYGPGYRWLKLLMDYGPRSLVAIGDVFATYAAGRSVAETWNRAPFGPAFFAQSGLTTLPEGSGAPRRQDDALILGPSLTSGQGPATYSASLVTSRGAKLYREGQLIAERSGLEMVVRNLPAAAARYRLETAVTRDPEIFPLSTAVSATWKFQSQAGTGQQILPLPVLRFAPALDLRSETSAAALLLPVRIERPSGSAAPPITEAKVEVSFDDGAHWRALPMVRVGELAVGLVVHPRGATHVSLRGSARDGAGNEVEQTMIRAYGVRAR